MTDRIGYIVIIKGKIFKQFTNLLYIIALDLGIHMVKFFRKIADILVFYYHLN